MTTPSIPQLANALTTLGLPTPHPNFLTPILTPGPSQRLPPLPALTATAKLRLLNADFTGVGILDPSKTLSLPPGITDTTIASRILDSDVPVQVVGIEDMSKSKWEQVEALEMERKGETAKGREVIRVVPPAEVEEPSTASTQGVNTQQVVGGAGGPFKLLLEDAKGQRVYGFELRKVDKVGYPPVMNIGCKVILKKGVKVARGMVLLEPATVVVLGGKIEALDKSWREGREKALRNAVGDGRGVRVEDSAAAAAINVD
jgi:RecQ-mediated genome instability protein 1